MKKSRLNELALAGEVQQELLTGITGNVQISDMLDTFENPNTSESNTLVANFLESEPEDEVNKKQATDSLIDQPVKPTFSSSEIFFMMTVT